MCVQVVTEAELRPVWEGRDSTQGISELDFSPDGKLLAAATFDAWIDIYNVEKGYQRIGKAAAVQPGQAASDAGSITMNAAQIRQWVLKHTGNMQHVVQRCITELLLLLKY